MRVLVTAAAEESAAAYAAALAGPEGEVVRLSQMGVRSLNRRLSPAEIDAVRRALKGVHAGSPMGPRPAPGACVGFVCTGRVLGAQSVVPAGIAAGYAEAHIHDGAAASPDSAFVVPDMALVAVSDHADLTYRAPLWGANRDDVGPRFPVMAGLYRPELVKAVFPHALVGDVVEVSDPDHFTAFESRATTRVGFRAATNQLASLAILAAHVGYGLAVLLVCDGKDGNAT